ncbi:tetratricopeptide repeat protein, partial [bacterium]|nr:tetratricopeptide repeat protein [bacterium]
SSRKSAAQGTALQQADTVLAADHWSREGWRKLAAAAAEADLQETAVFAWGAFMKMAPEDRDAGLGLVRALLEVERYAEAVTAVETLLQKHPKDGEALALLRRASIDHTVDKGKWDSDGSFRDKLRG